MMLTGLARLDTALEHIDEHPEEWEQKDWEAVGNEGIIG